MRTAEEDNSRTFKGIRINGEVTKIIGPDGQVWEGESEVAVVRKVEEAYGGELVEVTTFGDAGAVWLLVNRMELADDKKGGKR